MKLNKAQTIELLRNGWTKVETNGDLYIVLKTAAGSETETEVVPVAKHSPLWITSIELDPEGMLFVNVKTK